MVFVLNSGKQPVDPYHPAEARKLLKQGKAVVHKRYPFTIRLKEKVQKAETKEYHLKVDPGAKQTGISIAESNGRVVFVATINHHADVVKKNITQRRQFRRARRNRNTRYRQCRFLNRRRLEGRLIPSVNSIVDNIKNWVKRLQKLCPIAKIYVETVRFDTQLLENPDISGAEYQQGTLRGYEIKEYLLYTYDHECQYCRGESKDPVLEAEYKEPRSKGGSSSIKNLILSCHSCNQDKGNMTPAEWLESLLKKKYRTSLDQVKIVNLQNIIQDHFVGYKDVAKVNSSRKAVYKELGLLTSNLIISSGGITKYNREILNLPKTHYYDALCVREIPKKFTIHKGLKEYVITATGRGTRSRTLPDSYGFPRAYLPRQKNFYGFQSGDMVKAIVRKGKRRGLYNGTVGCRNTGYFNIKTSKGTVQGIKYTDCKVLQRNDGYYYYLRKVV